MSKLCKHCGSREATIDRWCAECNLQIARCEVKLSRADRKRMRPQYEAKPGSELTPRERDVMRLLSTGETMKACADALGIAHKSVHTYTQRVRGRLGSRSLVHLGCLLERHGLSSAMDEMRKAAAAGVML